MEIKDRNIKFNWKSVKSIPMYILSIYFLFIIIIYIKPYTFQKIAKDSILLIVFLWFLVTMTSISEITKVRRFFQKHSWWLNGLLLFVSPLLSFIIVEIMVSNYKLEMFENYSTFNVIWYAVIYFFIFAINRNIKTTVILSNFIIYNASFINYLVYLFRGNPILPSDILAWRTGISVAQNYELSFTKGFIISTFLMILLFVIANKLENTEVKISIKNRMIGVCTYFVFAGIVFITFFHTKLIQSTISVLDFFAPKYTYCSYGTAFGFVANVEALQAKSPEGYSADKVQSVLGKMKEDTVVSEVRPNIIVIMSEAYSDLSLLGDYKTNLEYRPYTKNLTENTIQGNLFVSVFGGATSDTEYEFLTGNSMAVMPKNCVPYQQFVTEPTDSLVSNLKTQGYYSIAIHPYEKSGYKRDIVYPLLGFDEFLSKDDFKNPELIRSFISDRESYKKIIEQYEGKGSDNPLFIFNVTMQNHGGYSKNKLFNDADNVRLTERAGFYETEQYLSLLRQSDKAFQLLVDYFSKQDEPTLILLYGDHQPIAFADFNNRNEEQQTSGIYEKKYEVPFVMWANYDIEEKIVDKMSANYLSSYLLKTAGLRSTEYNKYLMKLFEHLPVINGLFYMDKYNNCYGLGEESQYSNLVKEYQWVGYNNVFDKKKRTDSFYELEDIQK